MLQKVIQVGNSLAVTIPWDFAKDVGLKAGQRIRIDGDVDSGILTAQLAKPSLQKNGLTPEFLSWLKKFNAKYKTALAALAKK